MAQKLLSLLLSLSLLLCGCGHAPVDTTAPETVISEATTAPITIPVTEHPTEPPSQTISGPDVEDVILYFNEVCLDAEFVQSGDPSRLQKWEVPIRYRIYGSPTPEDTAVVNQFQDWLNTLEGFPGMQETENDWEANLRVHFCTGEELITLMGEDFYGTDGAVTFWYEQDAIYDAIICIRTDIPQTLRNSVILEELYNGLGPVQDTWLREDSIIFAGYSEPQQLTQVDELLLKLLYRPELQCGMNARECEILIRELYP